MEREKRAKKKKGWYYRPLSWSSHLNGNFHFIISALFIISCTYKYIHIYIYMCVCVLCVPLRAEGYERMWSSQTSFSLLWYWKLLQFFSLSLYISEAHSHTYAYTHSLFLSLCVLSLCRPWSLSFSFPPLLSLCCCSLQRVFLQITLWKMKDGSCTQYIKFENGGVSNKRSVVVCVRREERRERGKRSGRCSSSSSNFHLLL